MRATSAGNHLHAEDGIEAATNGRQETPPPSVVVTTPRRARREARPRHAFDGWFFAVWAVVAVLYSSTLAMRFGLYDDYRNAGADDLLRFDVGDGRPLAALVHATVFHHADRFSEFVWVRAVTIGLLGLCAALLNTLLRRAGLPAMGAAAVAVCAAATVSTQIIASWGVTLVVAPIAMLLGATGAAVTWQGLRLHRLRATLAGGLLFVAALCFYQPAAMAFWVVVFVAQACEDLAIAERVRRTLRLGLVAGVSLVVYLVIWKLGAALTDRPGARGELSSDPAAKLDWFWNAALRRAFHPFSLSGDGSGWLAVILAVVTMVGIGLFRRGNPIDRVAAVAACAGCFPLAYLPNLGTAESWASARSLAVLMPMAVVAGGIALFGLAGALERLLQPQGGTAVSRVGAAFVAAMTIPVLLRAQSNVMRYLVVPNAIELAAFEDAVREATTGEPAEVVLVPAEWTDTIAPGVSFDEFGYPATAATWALEPMARSAVADVGFGGTFRVINRSDLPTVPADAVVVDARVVLAEIDH